MALETLKWVAQIIQEREKEANQEYQQDKTEFRSGRSLAYTEMMEIIKNRMEIMEEIDGEKGA